MSKKIVVFGSFVVDLTARAPRLPVPGETVMGSVFKMGPGGKGSNQAVAAFRAGGDVTLVTKLGDDVFGRVALDFYQAEGMDTAHVFVDPSQDTGIALISVDENTFQNQILVVSGACGNITPEDVESCRELIASADILLLQQEINFDAIYKVIDIAYENDVRIILNTAPAAVFPDEVLRKLYMVTPNETEAELLTGIKVMDQASASEAASRLLAKGIRNVVITMGGLGVFATDGEKEELLPALKVDVIDTTGAGDAFNGGLAKAMADGMDFFTAIRYANVVGALSVTKKGTAPAMPQAEEVEALYRKIYC